jgi:hypothetical protein
MKKTKAMRQWRVSSHHVVAGQLHGWIKVHRGMRYIRLSQGAHAGSTTISKVLGIGLLSASGDAVQILVAWISERRG